MYSTYFWDPSASVNRKWIWTHRRCTAFILVSSFILPPNKTWLVQSRSNSNLFKRYYFHRIFFLIRLGCNGPGPRIYATAFWKKLYTADCNFKIRNWWNKTINFKGMFEKTLGEFNTIEMIFFFPLVMKWLRYWRLRKVREILTCLLYTSRCV